MALQSIAAVTRLWGCSHGILAELSSLQSKLHRQFPFLLLPKRALFSSSSSLPRTLPFVESYVTVSRRLFASAASEPDVSSTKEDISATEFLFIGPRMPAELEPRPKPSNAVEVVEQYIEKLWRDFFTNPHQWMDNRLKKRAPKYADFKHKITKEGLWITTKWNPLWVRVELSLMTNFSPIPFNDPVWYQKKTDSNSEGRESPRVGGQALSSSARSFSGMAQSQ